MKQILTFSLCCSFFLLMTNTQAQFYMRAGAGAGFGVSQDAFGLSSLERDSNNTVILQETIFGSFGGGARFGLAGGYWLTPAFGVELDVHYFQGFKQPYGSSTNANGSSYKRQAYSYQLRATPSLVVQATEGKFRPFARFGVVLPLWGQLIVEEDWQYVGARGTRSKETDIYGKFSLGFESSVGVTYAVNDRLGIYIQATYTGLRIRSQRAEVTKDEEIATDGTVTNSLETADVLFTQIEFQDVLTNESNTSSLLTTFFGDVPKDILVQINGTLDLDRPLNLPTQSSNSNALFLTLGIQYTFAKE